MGKSLFLDCLDFYYYLNYKDVSDSIFTNLAVQEHQSALRNSMHVLNLNFSNTDVISFERFDKSFNFAINDSIKWMKEIYNKISDFKIEEECIRTLENLAEEITIQNSSLLILIDEYDSSITKFFSKQEENENLKYNFNESEKVLSIFRMFFSTLKKILKYPKIYLFITGISSLNDFISGFNIGKYIGEDEGYAEILGYPEEFVIEGLQRLKIPPDFQEPVYNKLREDNNGYRYAYVPGTVPLYNPAKINYCFQNMQDNLEHIMFKHQ